MSRRDTTAEIVAFYQSMPEDDQRAFAYIIKCLADENRFGTIMTPIMLAQTILDAARDTRNPAMIRAAEEGMERVKRS